MPIDLTSLVATHLPRVAARFFPDLLFRAPEAEPGRTAHLSFDDGPTGRFSYRLLDVLEKHGARAVFFLLGEQARRYPSLVREIVAAGHAVGNHTYTHPDAWRAPRHAVLDELDRTTRLLEDLTGETVRWMRPPYGRFTPAMRDWCRANEQRMMMWDVMPGDYLPGATELLVTRRMLRLTRPGSVLVLHDNPKAEHCLPFALETYLSRLTRSGWSFPLLASEHARIP